MARNVAGTAGSSSSDSSHSLTERVRARVAEVGLVLDRRARASRPRVKRARAKGTPPAATPAPRTPEQKRESRSLTVVYNELAGAHRQHRLRTGQHASSALRDAADAFKESPSLPLLVVVAAFLEEDGLLAW